MGACFVLAAQSESYNKDIGYCFWSNRVSFNNSGNSPVVLANFSFFYDRLRFLWIPLPIQSSDMAHNARSSDYFWIYLPLRRAEDRNSWEQKINLLGLVLHHNFRDISQPELFPH